MDDFDVVDVSGINDSEGLPLLGLNTAMDGIVYCGTVDMFSCEPCDEFDLLSPVTGK